MVLSRSSLLSLMVRRAAERSLEPRGGSPRSNQQKISPPQKTSIIIPPSLPRRTDCSEHLRGEPVRLDSLQGSAAYRVTLRRAINRGRDGQEKPGIPGRRRLYLFNITETHAPRDTSTRSTGGPGAIRRAVASLSGKTRWPQHPPQRFRLLRTVPYGTPANGKAPGRSVPFEWERFPWPWPSRSTKRHSPRASRLC